MKQEQQGQKKQRLKKYLIDIYTITNLHITGIVTVKTQYDHLRTDEIVRLADRNKTGFIVLEDAEVYRSGAVETLLRKDKFTAVSVYSIVSLSVRKEIAF